MPGQEPLKVGVLLSRVAGCQLGYELLRQLPAIHQECHDDVSVYFCNQSRPHRTPNFASFNITEAFGFDGVAVATSFGTARTLLRCPGPSRRLFWVWDPEWTHVTGMYYEDWAAVYSNPRLELVARSRCQRSVIEQVWDVKVASVIEDDFGELLRFIRESTVGQTKK